MSLPKSLQSKIEFRKAENSFRSLKTNQNLIDFSSNDFFGLAQNQELISETTEKFNSISNKFLGATGSRLISGNTPFHQKLEEKLAKIHQSESALLFNSGYNANLGLLSSIPQKNDTILMDEKVHASIKDGARLSFAKKLNFKHNNSDDLEKKLSKSEGEKYVIVESLYSMDGDFCDIENILKACEKHNAHLIVANTVVNGYNFDEVWFLFSDEGYALNHKGEELLSLKNRILLLKNAILDNPYFKLAKLDYKNDENNSVAESLLKISSKYKDYKFSLIMGADYLYDIDSLKSSKYIENNFPIFYYERGGAYMSNINKVVRVESVDRNIKKIEGLLETNISSSKVRRILIEENGIDKLKYIVPEACLNVLEQKGFYKTNKLKKITNE